MNIFSHLHSLLLVSALLSFCPAWAQVSPQEAHQKLENTSSDFQDPWVKKVMGLKDAKLTQFVLNQYQKFGAAGLKDKKFRARVNDFVARNYRLDLRRVDNVSIPERESPFFMMGSVSTTVAFYGEDEDLPTGATVGGGSGPTNGIPNSANLTLMGGYILSADDQIAGLYMHTLRFSEQDQTNSDSTFVPPDNISGITYTHDLSRFFDMQVGESYLDTTGFQDPTLGLSYTKDDHPEEEAGYKYILGVSLSAPVSDKSQQLGKITTLALSGSFNYKTPDWKTRLKINYSYTYYKNDEVLNDSEDTASGAYSGGGTTENDDGTITPNFPSYDVNYTSRELARTMVNFTEKYRLASHFDLGIAAKVSYSFLNSTFSKWSSNCTLLSVGAHASGLSAEMAATLTSLTFDQDRFTLPSNLGVKLTLSYTLPLFGDAKPELFSSLKENMPSGKKGQ